MHQPTMTQPTVRQHYERHPYPQFPLLATVRRCDTYALDLQAIWAAANGVWLPPGSGRILLAGCGAFSPYPFRLANPEAAIDAVDLSRANLDRAGWHCRLHGCSGVRFLQGDLLDEKLAPGPYHLIDAFGVLHHLAEPLAGFRSLAARLAPGGVLRVMVYGRYARQEAEAVRHACRLLGIADLAGLKRLLQRAATGSRLREFLDHSAEARTDSGLADLFLHPCATTYRIDQLLELATAAGLTPLRFGHRGALAEPAMEIARLRGLDRQRATDVNFICYLGRDPRGPAPLSGATALRLNPALAGGLAPWRLRPRLPAGRLGQELPPLDRAGRRLLRTFTTPVPAASLSSSDLARLRPFLDQWLLLACRAAAAEA